MHLPSLACLPRNPGVPRLSIASCHKCSMCHPAAMSYSSQINTSGPGGNPATMSCGFLGSHYLLCCGLACSTESPKPLWAALLAEPTDTLKAAPPYSAAGSSGWPEFQHVSAIQPGALLLHAAARDSDPVHFIAGRISIPCQGSSSPRSPISH